jgi:hypothetical protein
MPYIHIYFLGAHVTRQGIFASREPMRGEAEKNAKKETDFVREQKYFYFCIDKHDR